MAFRNFKYGPPLEDAYGTNLLKLFPIMSFRSIANTLSQRVISELGLAVGLLLWMSTNCIIGWSIGRFGLFGIERKPIENDFLNVLGLVALLLGQVIIF